MALTRARIIKKSAGAVEPSRAIAVPDRVRKAQIEAKESAGQILVEARAKAASIIGEAEERAKSTLEALRARVRGEEEERLAAAFVLLREQDEQRFEADFERHLQVAKLVAERLLGEALQLDPDRVAELARSAMTELRASRAVRIEAHPSDAVRLRAHSEALGRGLVLEIVESDDLRPGSLRLTTDLGRLDASIALRIERLVESVRGSLRPPREP